MDVSEQQVNSPNRLSSLPANRPTSLLPVSISSLQQQQDWRRQIANRATKTWLRDWSSLGVSVSTTPPNAPVTQPVLSASLLEAEWATVPSGQTAAPEILRRLAKQSHVDGVPDVLATRSKLNSPGNKNSPPVFSSFSSQSPAPAQRGLCNDEMDLGAKFLDGISKEREQLHVQETDLTFHTQSPPDAQTGERLRSSKHFAPPSLTPSLPQLLPAVGPSAAVLPIASDTARYGAWRDESNAREKDLGLLAAQVKQILDEEARRHGIDV